MGLGDLVLDTLKKVVDYIIELADDFADVLKRGILMIIEHLENEFKSDIEDVIPKELFEEEHFKVWKEYVEKHAGEKPIPILAILAMLGASAAGTAIGMGLGGFGRNIQNWFNTQLTPMPLSPQECAYFLNRNPTEAEKVEAWLKANGYAPNLHYTLIQMYKPKLTISEITTAYLRGIIDEKQFKYLLSEHGLSERDIDYLKQIIWDYPSPTDFIRFSVREVFTTDKETKEALQAEFPKDIVPYAKKAGMSEDVLMWYWMAHWELPSPTQVYEMLHRLNPKVLEVRGEAYKQMGINVENIKTTIDTVKTFLKQADYDIRWRDRLLAISYSPLTRVDLRRIYTLGLIDDKELKARLMEIGYTEKDAELLMEFYRNLKAEEAREWTKSEIRNLLYYGLINDTEAKIMLERLGYEEEDAKLLIDLWKAKITEKDMRETQRYIRDAYALGQITRAEAEAQLKACGLSEEVIKVVLDKEEKRRMSSQRLPSASTIVKWLKLGIITKDVAYRLLKRINVADDVIDYYIKEAEVS